MIHKDEYYPWLDGDELASIYDREGWDKKKLYMFFDFLKRINSYDSFECWADTSCEEKMNAISCGEDAPFFSVFDIGKGEPSSFTLFDGKSETSNKVAKVTIIERQVNEISIEIGRKSVEKCVCSDDLRGILEMIADKLLSIQKEADD